MRDKEDADRFRSIILRARSALETAPVSTVADILGELEDPPAPECDYRIALRPHQVIKDAEDDIVVNDVSMFRLEQMDKRAWFACCYLRGEDDGNRIAWSISYSHKDREVVVTTTEYPTGVAYEDDTAAGAVRREGE